MSKIRELKCWPEAFEQTWHGLKPFEVRRDDGAYGMDVTAVRLREWRPSLRTRRDASGEYTGREIIAAVSAKTFTSEAPEAWGLLAGMVVLALDVRERIGVARFCACGAPRFHAELRCACGRLYTGEPGEHVRGGGS